MKGLVTRNLHLKYENPTTYGSRDIAKVKVQGQGQGHQVKGQGLEWKGKWIYMWNMKTLLFTVQEILPRLKFKVKVKVTRSKVKVSSERSRYEESTC